MADKRDQFMPIRKSDIISALINRAEAEAHAPQNGYCLSLQFAWIDRLRGAAQPAQA
jgi:hypothetical protein